MLGWLNKDVKTKYNLAQKERKRAEQDAFIKGIAKAKETEEGNNKEKEKEYPVFNRFVERVVENIHPKTITNGLKGESWKEHCT